MKKIKENFYRRQSRVRIRLRAAANGKLRLSVFRSNKNIYAQLIDDAKRATIVSASTVDKELSATLKTGGDKAAAAEVGKLIAKRAIEKGAKEIIFDRGGYLYHGRVKALADAAREHGLVF